MHRGALAWLVVFVAACAYDRDAFYEPREAAALTPYEAALRVFGDDAACVACVERECESEARACSDAADCGGHALCRAGCNDPICRIQCDDPYPLGGRPDGPLELCAIEMCAEPCPVGRDWSCVDEYARPVLESDEPFRVRLQPIPGQIADPLGIVARACGLLDPACDEPLSEAEADAEGLVEVELRPDSLLLSGFTASSAYIELSDPQTPPRLLTTLQFTSWGWVFPNTHPYPLTAITPAFAQILAGVHGQPTPPQRAISGVVWDCQHSQRARATGVTVEVSTADENTTYSYGLLASQPDRTPADGVFSVLGISPGLVTVTIDYEGMPVARMNVHVREDAFTSLWLFPTTLD